MTYVIGFMLFIFAWYVSDSFGTIGAELSRINAKLDGLEKRAKASFIRDQMK